MKPIAKFWSAGSRSVLSITFVAFILAGLATRTVLVVWAWPLIEPDPLALARIYAIGFVYDLALSLYAVLPLAAYACLAPARLWQGKANRIAMHGFFVLVFATLIFTFCAELLFWEEFAVRFNFIAVDYLVYTHEVVQNIMESYPMPALVAGLLAGALTIWRMLRQRIGEAMDVRPPLTRRLAVLAALGLAATVAILGLDQRLHHLGTNNYRNELASSGPYQFFAAFRNNELDYAQNFAPLPEAEVAAELRHVVARPGETFLDNAEPMDIVRHVPSTRPADSLNIVLVMVESFSPHFLGYFGGKDDLAPNLDALIDESLFSTISTPRAHVPCGGWKRSLCPYRQPRDARSSSGWDANRASGRLAVCSAIRVIPLNLFTAGTVISTIWRRSFPAADMTSTT
jgi:phosphoglycerol transferase MdoB-like AlkP superfamily enzyme